MSDIKNIFVVLVLFSNAINYSIRIVSKYLSLVFSPLCITTVSIFTWILATVRGGDEYEKQSETLGFLDNPGGLMNSLLSQVLTNKVRRKPLCGSPLFVSQLVS